MISRNDQAKLTKEKIRKAAFELILELSFDEVSINQICNKAKVTKGAFYHHYNSKSDIVIEIYEANVLSQLNLNDVIESSKTSLEKIHDAILTYLHLLFKDSPAFVRQVIIHEITIDESVFLTEGVKVYDILRQIIETGQKNKEIRSDLSSNKITNYLVIFIRGTAYDYFIKKCSYDFFERIESDMKIYLPMLKPKH
ncbi:MAG: TetR/AcrR family transcriptional regulator [Vallitalea sp.]|jgi:AcrR family transcriptional regulator|nr:TetR/AcrR family transcriptional regulator [Vallitalea sp.]